jgi:hypothetical protein
LVRLETNWLQEVRNIVGESDNDDKDVPADLITPQVLTRVVSLTYFIYQIESGKVNMPIDDSVYIIKEAIQGLNIFLANPTLKGRLRKTKVIVNEEEINAYNFLVRSGVHAGGYGKFLPNPEKSLPFIFSHFCREAILPSAYK